MSLHRDNSNQVNSNQVTSINQERERDRAGNKLDVKRITEETKTLIDIQENVGQPDTAKVIANHEILSSKIQLIKSYYEQVLDSINTDADIEIEIVESSEFGRMVNELMISINMWLKSHEDDVMSDRTVP